MPDITEKKVALVTGGSKRIGAEICKKLHLDGWRVVIHNHHSVEEAKGLAEHFNALAPDSARIVTGDLTKDIQRIADNALDAFWRIDAIINNASIAPTDQHLNDNPSAWGALFQCNTFAPYQLTNMLRAELSKNMGGVVNLLDVRATTINPAENWAMYTATKVALYSLTISSAKELAPHVRVNAVSPGITLPFPGEEEGTAEWDAMKSRSLLGRVASPTDIADAVLWLTQAHHVTGQVITVDGGESYRW